MPAFARSSSKTDSRTRSRFAQYPFALHEIGGRQSRAPDPGVLGPDDDDQLIPRHRRAGEMLIVDGTFDKA